MIRLFEFSENQTRFRLKKRENSNDSIAEYLWPVQNAILSL